VQRDQMTILRRPIVTEKNMARTETRNTYTFEVDPNANKIEIRNAVEKLFNVKVDTVHTVNVHGKQKRRGMQVYQTGGLKKAIVKLREGSKIELV